MKIEPISEFAQQIAIRIFFSTKYEYDHSEVEIS
jgi:hypothetical protein